MEELQNKEIKLEDGKTYNIITYVEDPKGDDMFQQQEYWIKLIDPDSKWVEFKDGNLVTLPAEVLDNLYDEYERVKKCHGEKVKLLNSQVENSAKIYIRACINMMNQRIDAVTSKRFYGHY